MPEMYRDCRLITVVTADGYRVAITPLAMSNALPGKTLPHQSLDAALREARSYVDYFDPAPASPAGE